MSDLSKSIRDELLKTYSKLELQNANEADTRIKLIDRILYEVLGWTHDDIFNEERVSEDGKNEYADYIIRTANTGCVVEAKRIGQAFLINSPSKRVPLTGGIMEGKSGESIRQVRDYCRKKGIQFAIATNGAQWMIFPAIRIDQVDFHSSTAIVFDSLDSCLNSDYEFFKSLLSRESVINGNLETELIGRNQDQLNERRLRAFFKATQNPSVNPIFPLIETAVYTAFSDSIFEGDISLIEKCYVKNADRMKFDNRIKMHLSKREPIFREKPIKPMRKKDAGSLKSALEAATTSAKPVAMLILGPVGVGKTTFINYSRRVTASDYFEVREDREYPHWINIDFRDFSPGDSPIEFLVNRIFEYMQSDPFFSQYNRGIRSAYKEEIDALKKGPLFLLASDQSTLDKKITEIITADYEKRRPYVEKLLTYACRKVPVFIVIDNVDQLEKESLQAEIFSDSIAFVRLVGSSLILSMRESTYIQHRHRAIFDAFEFDPIQLEAPPISQVLSARLFVVKQLLTGVSGQFTAPKGAQFKVNDLSVFVDLLQFSILGTEIGRYIEVLANRDVRLGLRMTREFLERGYTDPSKALTKYQSNQHYVLPKHEAFRAIILSNQPVYDEKYCVIGNPFDSHVGKNSAQLLRLFLLSAIVRMSSEATFEYLDGPTIRDSLSLIGFSNEHISKVLEDLCKFRFLHTASHGEPDFNSNFYASRLGGYIIKELIGEITFLENVMMDTFIADEKVWNELKNSSARVRSESNVVEKLKIRLRNVSVFYKYMIRCYEPLVEEANRRGLPAEWCAKPLSEARSGLRKRCMRALRSAVKNYGKKGVEVGSLEDHNIEI